MERKQGMTLAEICVVLAIVAIMTSMIVSFVIIVSRETKIGTEYLDAVREIRLVEMIVEQEIESGDDISQYIGDDPTTPLINNGVLQLDDRKVNLSAITKVTIAKIINNENEEPFYVCTITYTLGGEEPTYRFCVDPIVGDVIYVEGTNENQQK